MIGEIGKIRPRGPAELIFVFRLRLIILGLNRKIKTKRP